jgi:hypothetical protein
MCCLLWRIYEMHPALSLKFGCDNILTLFVLMFGVLLFLSTSCLFVCVATSSGEVTSHPKTNLVR